MPIKTTPPIVADNSAFGGPNATQAATANTALGIPTPNVATPIDVSTLGTTAPFTLPAAPTPPNYAATLNSIPSVASIVSQESDTTPAEVTNNNLGSSLLNQEQKLVGKSAAQTTAEANAGLPTLNAQLTDINGQIQSLQKEAQAIPLQDQQDATGRGITAAGLAPIDAGKLRENTIKTLQLSAVAQTLQGNIALAQQTANKAVAAEFDPIQAEIDYIQKAIDLNAPNMTKEEKVQADKVQAQLQDRQTQLDQAKQDKTTILGWAAEAAKNGANSVLINQAMTATDPNQALQILGQYLSDPIAKEQALANLALTRANTNKTNVEAAVAADPSLKPATQAQQTVAGYASRLTQSNQIINDLSSTIANKNPLSYAAGGILPSFLQGADRQQYDQATRNFVNAVLRQESGAAISPSEFDSAQKQYFPQPGDSPQVITQKAANRDLVVRNFINASGSAYEAPPSTNQTYTVNGTTYVQGADGLYYPQ